jgi:hypothetical protein
MVAKWWFLGLTMLLLAACAPKTDSSTNSTAAPVQTAAPKAVVMNPTGTLATGEASAVNGSAQVIDLGNGKSQVVVTLSGLPANSAHMGHIHVGDCSVVGPVVLGLNAVNSDAAGNGTSVSEVTTAQIPADAYIAYHQRGPNDAAGIGSFISCGNIPK